MVSCSKDSGIYAACSCQNMICPITLLVVGVVLGIAGCVIAAVGFGKPPEDMFDTTNLAMRISGLVLVGIAILPIAISVCAWVFYCSNRRQKKDMPDTKKPAYTTSVQNPVPLAEYTYSSDSGGNRIYRPQQPPTYPMAVGYNGEEPDESSVPLKFSSASDSFNVDHSMQYHDTSEVGNPAPVDESQTAVKKKKKSKKSEKSKDSATGNA